MLDAPIPELKNRFKELIDCGADIIIGHYPHIVQGYELYKDMYIFYSLGNFCFDYKITSVVFNRKPGINILWHNLFIERNIWLVKSAIRLLNLR